MTDFSYQLYSSRNFPPMADTLSMLAGLGYTQVEGFGALFDSVSPSELRDLLGSNGLTMPTAHIGVELLETNPAKALGIIETLDLQAALGPYLQEADRPSDSDGWQAFGTRLAAAGTPLMSHGVAFGWHNHDFELIKTPQGDYPLDLIMDAHPDLKLELDLAWVAFAGEDPVAWVNKYKDRLISVHIKDLAPKGENADEDGWADPGHGTMDWAAISAAVKASSAEYLIVEHDNPSDHQRFASRAIATARRFWS